MQRRACLALALTLALLLGAASALQLRASSPASGSGAPAILTAAQDDDPVGLGSVALVPTPLLLVLFGLLLACLAPGSSAAAVRFAPGASRSRAPPMS